jgi:hypothetical protein
MTKPNGTALARVPEQVATEKVPEAETLVMPAVLLQAAELTCARDETAPGYMRGVYLHAVEGRGRIVATDGQRMFLASFAIEGKAPSWLKSGVVVSSQDLKTRLSLIQKIGGEPTVKFIFSKGNPTIELTDMRSTILLKVPVVSTSYPDYSKLLGAESFTDLDGDGDARVRDWQPIGINSQYLKKCGEIAKILESGLEKDARSKLGMVVRAFNSGAADAPMVFDFSTWPGAILVVAPTDCEGDRAAAGAGGEGHGCGAQSACDAVAAAGGCDRERGREGGGDTQGGRIHGAGGECAAERAAAQLADRDGS